ncbi:MAG: hypothetical protein AB7P49_11330 [Bdellovibrionales bacterium]
MTSTFELHRIHNLTSQVDIHTKKQKALEVVEYGPSTLVFQSHEKAILGQLLNLEGRLTIGGETVTFHATGKVVGITVGEHKLNRFEIHLNQFDQFQWNRFLAQSKARQGRVDKIFNSIRGEDE